MEGLSTFGRNREGDTLVSWLTQQTFDLDLERFLHHESLEGGIVFVSSPRAWRVAKVSSGKLEFGPASALKIDDIFALEGFQLDQNGISFGGINFRWSLVNNVGHGVILRDLPETIDPPVGAEKCIRVNDAIITEYYLWGKVSPPWRRGWAKLSDPRIGSMWIPLEVAEPSAYVKLRKRELLSYGSDNDGMATVIDELLLDFQWTKNWF